MARKPQAMASEVSVCVRSSFQAVPYMIEGTATPRTRRVSPIAIECMIAGSRAVLNYVGMPLLAYMAVRILVFYGTLEAIRSCHHPYPSPYFQTSRNHGTASRNASLKR